MGRTRLRDTREGTRGVFHLTRKHSMHAHSPDAPGAVAVQVIQVSDDDDDDGCSDNFDDRSEQIEASSK